MRLTFILDLKRRKSSACVLFHGTAIFVENNDLNDSITFHSFHELCIQLIRQTTRKSFYA